MKTKILKDDMFNNKSVDSLSCTGSIIVAKFKVYQHVESIIDNNPHYKGKRRLLVIKRDDFRVEGWFHNNAQRVDIKIYFASNTEELTNLYKEIRAKCESSNNILMYELYIYDHKPIIIEDFSMSSELVESNKLYIYKKRIAYRPNISTSATEFVVNGSFTIDEELTYYS